MHLKLDSLSQARIIPGSFWEIESKLHCWRSLCIISMLKMYYKILFSYEPFSTKFSFESMPDTPLPKEIEFNSQMDAQLHQLTVQLCSAISCGFVL